MLASVETMKFEMNTAISHRDSLIKNFDRTKRVWLNSEGEVATQEQKEEYQGMIRDYNNCIAICEENLKVMQGTASLAEHAQLMPIVSRRAHEDKWPRVNKVSADRTIFTFSNKDEYIDVPVCNCTDLQLKKDIISGTHKFLSEQHIPHANAEFPVTEEMYRSERQLHTMKLQQGDKEMCRYPLIQKLKIFQKKHTIGNWNCKACLNLGSRIETAEDANKIDDSVKALEWCPRFIPLLRKQDFLNYLAALKDNNTCYAGLLHSEMSFAEEGGKKYIVITKMCDTCNYTDTEKKEYVEPEVVKDNQILECL